MAGGFTCPYCDTFNRCSCKNCKETYIESGVDEKSGNFVKWDDDGELLICSSCNKKFHEGQSLDIEWDRMIRNISKILTKDICLRWLSIVVRKDEALSVQNYDMATKIREEERNMYKEYDFSEEWFVRVIWEHFRINAHLIRKGGISSFRDIQINNILQNGN